MVAINGTSTGYLGSSGAPSIDTVEWASLQHAFGQEYFVATSAAGKVTVVSGTTVRVAAGVIGGRGVVDTFTGPRDLTLPTPGADGTIHYLVAARRTWQTAQATTIEYVTGTSTRAIPAGRNVNPGVIDDHPLALVAVTKSGATVTAVVVDDLRAIGYGSGNYEATSELVLSYMDKPGYRIRIAGTEWLRTMAGTWEKVASPITTSSGIIATYQDGWNADAPGTSYMVRDGRRRSMFLELRRQGSSIAVGSTGSIANHSVRQLDEQDRPAYPVPATGLYRNSGGADYGCTLQIDPNGHVFFCHATPNADITYMEPGNWSLRVYATWYTA